MIYKKIEGISLGERFAVLSNSAQRELGHRLASTLSTLTQVRFEGAGELADAWRATDSSWRAFAHRSFLEGVLAVRANGLIEEKLDRALYELEGQVDSYVGSEANASVWVDISLENIIVDSDGNFQGVIDFESVLAGNPLLTLGSCYARYGEHEFFHSIVRSWPVPLTEMQWKQVYYYAVFRTLRVAKYADQPLPTGLSRAPLVSVFPGFALALERLRSGNIEHQRRS